MTNVRGPPAVPPPGSPDPARPAGRGRRQLGQPPGRPDAAVPDGPLVRGRETAGDAGPGQVNHGVHAGEQVRSGLVRLPLALVCVLGRVPDQLDHTVAAGAEQGGQRGSDEPAGPGDRDRHRLTAVHPCPAVGGQVGRELPVPVGEHLAERRRGHRSFDVVADPGLVLAFRLALGAEHVGVPPGHHRRQPGRHQLVDELMRRVVAVRLVGRHPAHAARQQQHGAAVAQRAGLLADADRVPRRQKAGDRAGTRVPLEHLADRRVHHA